MDRFTRNYSVVLGIIVIAVFVMWMRSTWQPRVWEINQVLESDPAVSDYPYQFRVLSLENGVATISTPRSAAFPAIQFLPIVYPELAGLSDDHPAMVKAQQSLVDHQKRAMEVVEALPDVKSVTWGLDVQWLADHGVQVQNTR
ncbi:MAG: hypothetical protein JZU52_06640 [Lamprocystis purpurea]|uniref:hypothetical protein n=1 Tax=Lamprocystis purpurea TaxID=61598 RepID=UPI00039EC8E8|nr:hypothetical protein [Lamprocystis purpurea]MBV5273318.1 hypothetical protein [Lamprocystis purpurea]